MYDIASITKSIPTASLALMLIDQGELKLTDKLIDHVPEFNNSDRENVLIKHLLTYTLDGYKLATALDGGKFDAGALQFLADEPFHVGHGLGEEAGGDLFAADL